MKAKWINLGDIKLSKKQSSIFIALILLLISLSLFRKADNDIWFLLNHGKYVLANGFPSTEPFSIHENLNFIMQQWLSAIIFYSTYSSLGFVGLKILVFLSFTLGALIHYKLVILLSNGNKFKSLLLTSGYVIFMHLFMITRPYILTSIIFLLELYALEAYFKFKNSKYLILLPVLSLIQINLQAAMWLMLFVLLIPYFVEIFLFKILRKNGESTSLLPIATATVVMGIMGLINPYGSRSMSYIFKSYGIKEISNIVSEMNPATATSILGLSIILLVFIANYVFVRNRTLARTHTILLVLGTSLLSLMNIRGFYFFILCSFSPLHFILDQINVPVFNHLNVQRTMKIRYGLIILLCLLTPIAFFRVSKANVAGEDPLIGLFEITRLLKEDRAVHEIKVYTGYNDGGLLQFEGIPTYIDTRAEVYLKVINQKEDIFKEYYNLQTGQLHYKLFLEKYHFTHVITNKSDILRTYLNEDPDFELLQQSEHHNLYRRKDWK